MELCAGCSRVPINYCRKDIRYHRASLFLNAPQNKIWILKKHKIKESSRLHKYKQLAGKFSKLTVKTLESGLKNFKII